ncbi:MAG: hypothetical protein JXR37_13995 [Kiritimatiellae bacterium]|nr:hypothetical protein [Kiritimatiellia bacterium]
MEPHTTQLARAVIGLSLLTALLSTAAGSEGGVMPSPPTPTPTPALAPTPMPAAPLQGVKWHPGHYVLLSKPARGYDQREANEVLRNPYLQGLQLVYRWRDFEKSKDNYDFSSLKGWADYMGSKGKRVTLLLMWQIYGYGTNCVPDYLKTDPVYEGGQSFMTNSAGSSRRCWPNFWVPAVTDRIIALHNALAKELDHHPYFEAYQRAEVSVPKPVGWSGPAFNPTVSAQALREFEALGAAFQHTCVLFGATWITTGEEYFVQAQELGTGGIWGPDLAINTRPEKGSTAIDITKLNGTWAYPYYPRYRNRIPLGISDQAPTKFLAPHIKSGLFTMDFVWEFAITNPKYLSVNYMFWTGWQPYFWSTELPYINAKQGYINTTCPENITKHGGGANRN